VVREAVHESLETYLGSSGAGKKNRGEKRSS